MMTKNDAHSYFEALDSKTGKPIELAMQELLLTGQILPVGALLRMRHVFRCAERQPVEVIYAFALPRDAALQRFRIVGEGFSVSSDLKPVEEAAKIYEKSIAAGHLSSLARQYGDGVINLSVGNLRPGETVAVYLDLVAGVELRDDGIRFRFPFTLAPTYHAKARMIEAEPGVGEMELPEEFGDVILPRWMKDGTGLHRVGFDLFVTMPQPVTEIGSPSHAIQVRREENGRQRVTLALEKDVPDRDLVLDAHMQGSLAGIIGGTGKDGKGHFAAIIPSAVFGQAVQKPRRIVFVMDRSGSMGGVNMDQSRRAIEACLGVLTTKDKFGLVAFDDKTECFESRLMEGSRRSCEAARAFLKQITARGGTELANGFREAAKLLGKDGGDVLVLTDGQVSGTEQILAQARLTGIRLHCLGIGSASQDRFLTLLARETGGISRFVTPKERVDMAAVDLFASIRCPLARGLRVGTKHADGVAFVLEPPSAIFAGSPLLLLGGSNGNVDGAITLAWDGKGGKRQVKVPLKTVQSAEAEMVWLLQGSRLITDMEAKLDMSDGQGATGKRESKRISKLLEKLSLQYGLASRRAALVAVVKRKGDKAGGVPKTMVVPVGIPQDTAFDSYFAGRVQSSIQACCLQSNEAPQSYLAEYATLRESSEWQTNPADVLLALAGRIELDGGMPGKNDAERWEATAVALLCFLAEGHTAHSGTFREHVKKLMAFLKAASSSTTEDLKRQPDMADVLLALAGRIELDGGMPGKNDEERWEASTVALLCFLAEGHTAHSGTFRERVKKLTAFLKTAPSSATEDLKRQLVERGTSFPGRVAASI